MTDRRVARTIEAGAAMELGKDQLLEWIFAGVKEPYADYKKKTIKYLVENQIGEADKYAQLVRYAHRLMGDQDSRYIHNLDKLTVNELMGLVKELKKMSENEYDKYNMLKPILSGAQEFAGSREINSHDKAQITRMINKLERNQGSPKNFSVTESEAGVVFTLMKYFSKSDSNMGVTFSACPSIESAYAKYYLNERILRKRLKKEKERVINNLKVVNGICDRFLALFESLEVEKKKKIRDQKVKIDGQKRSIENTIGRIARGSERVGEVSDINRMDGYCVAVRTNLREVDVSLLTVMAADEN